MGYVILMCFCLTPEEKSAETAAKINATVRSQVAASAINEKVWILTTSWSTRAPVGHTHTCKNGHTWDHQLTTSHNCPYCNAFQNVQDRNPRPVTIKAAPPVVLPSGCENGQCQTQTRRFFR